MIDRRSFLRILAGTAAGVVLDPELALWVPGSKKIFLPSGPAIYSGRLFTSTMEIDLILKQFYVNHIDTMLMEHSPLFDLLRHTDEARWEEPTNG